MLQYFFCVNTLQNKIKRDMKTNTISFKTLTAHIPIHTIFSQSRMLVQIFFKKLIYPIFYPKPKLLHMLPVQFGNILIVGNVYYQLNIFLPCIRSPKNITCLNTACLIRKKLSNMIQIS